MTLERAEALAWELMEAHGLRSPDATFWEWWRFAWNHHRTSFGRCHHKRRAIYLSSIITPYLEDAEIRDTILHEIAHALAGHDAGHGPVWRKKAREIGANPRRCAKSLPRQYVLDTATYLLECPSCEGVFARFRRHDCGLTYYCATCDVPVNIRRNPYIKKAA